MKAIAPEINRATLPERWGADGQRQYLQRSFALRPAATGFSDTGLHYRAALFTVMAVVGLVLLIACANIANLLLARAAARQREISVRMAIGAGRSRVMRQLMTESLLLSVLGAGGGLLFAIWGSHLLVRLLSKTGNELQLDVAPDLRVLAFTIGVAILTGLLFGMAPALAAARAEVTHGLKETAQTTTRRRKGIGGKALVGFQIALSTLLVIGAGLFLRTLVALNKVDVGFRTDRLLLVEINPPVKVYPAGKDVTLHRRLEEAFAAVPGVDSVAPSWEAYVSDDSDRTTFLPQGVTYDPNNSQSEDYNGVGNRFFETLGIPIIAGRAFGEQDTATSQKVAIINQSLARARFPGQNPIGKMFTTSTHDADGHKSTTGDDWIRIVGVCADTRYANLRDVPPPQFILPYIQQTQVGGMTYEIRTRLKPEVILPSLRRVVQQADPDLPLVNVRTQDQQIEADLQQERIFVTLTSGFGLLALALACVGIYGIMAYSVANRRNEIGIRMALGAQPAQVRGMILRESTWLAIAGIVVGVGAALLLTRMIKSMLYGIQPWDPPTLTVGVLILLTVALAASWIPARRAARVQPMDALRHE